MAAKVRIKTKPGPEDLESPAIGTTPHPDPPHQVDPLQEFKKALKWGSFSAAPAQGRNPRALFDTLLQDLADQGVDDTLLSRLRRRGPEAVLRSGSLGKEYGDQANESLKLARQALRGLKKGQVHASIDQSLKLLKESGADEKLLAEIGAAVKKMGPEEFSKIPFQQVVAGLAERGQEGRIAGMWNALRGRAPRGTLAPAAAEAALAEGAATTATKVALKRAGVSMGTRAGLGKILPAGIGAALTAYQLYDTFYGKPQQAEQTARLGAVSSWEYIRQKVQEQDLLERRKSILATQEPGLMDQMLRTLAQRRTEEQPSPLTKTEMAIGSVALPAAPRYKPQEPPTELIDTLLKELG